MSKCPLPAGALWQTALPSQHCNVWSLTNSVSEAMIQISSDIEHVPSASALRERLLSERRAWENWEGIIFGRNVVLVGMRQIETKEIFYPLNWSLLCRPWKKGENPHQSPSGCKFSGLSDLNNTPSSAWSWWKWEVKGWSMFLAGRREQMCTWEERGS